MDFSEKDLQAQALELQQQYAENVAFDEHEDETFFHKEDNGPEYKKYVIRVDSEHIPLVEQLSYEERNIFFNELIDDYIQNDIEAEEAENFSRKIKKGIAVTLLILVGIPLFLWVFTKSLDATQSNYQDMQNRFENLYKEKKRY